MRRTIALLAAALVLVVFGLAGGEARDGPEERSPFDMVRWTEEGPQVQVNGTWYELVSLGGVPMATVIGACKKLDADNWEKRFCEDLVAAFAKVGLWLGDRVDLEVRKPGSKTVERLAGVAATNAKRDRIRDARPWKRRAGDVKRVAREHAGKPAAQFAFLTTRHFPGSVGPGLSQRAAHEDLDQLEWLIESVFSYRDLRKLDRRAAFDTLRLGIGKEGIAHPDFHLQLQKLVSLFGDGHAGVSGVGRAYPRGALPFALVEANGRVAAVTEQGRPFDPPHPYVETVDKRPIEDWLEAAAAFDARGSRAFVRRHALLVACNEALIRRELGLHTGGRLTFTLSNGKGEKKTHSSDVARRQVRLPRVRDRRSHEPRRLEHGIGYVSIPRMRSNKQFIEQTLRAVESFRDAPGLVIDVRGNGGGSRDLLNALMPHLLPEGAQPVVGNVAAYRLPPGVVYDAENGHLDNRALHPPGWQGFTPAERKTAAAAVKSIRPEMKLHPKLFTPLHVMVHSPAPAGEWRFTKPIVVLIDAGCFSATDIFVGALETLPNVTLVGAATGGGSGRSKKYTLLRSGLDVRLSTMASFRPNGKLYEGRGIEPDVRVEATPADIGGATDTALAKAIQVLRRKPR